MEEVLKDYPEIHIGIVDAGEVKEVAERFLIFTGPVLMLFIEGNEALGKRIVHVDLFRGEN